MRKPLFNPCLPSLHLGRLPSRRPERLSRSSVAMVRAQCITATPRKRGLHSFKVLEDHRGSPQLQTVERPRRPSRVDTSGRGGGGYEASTRDVSRCCNRARSCARCRPWRLVLRWLPLEAVKASYWHRVNLGDTDELVGGLIGSEGVLWPRLVADTVCGRLTRRSVGLVVCRRGLVRGSRERPLWSKCECILSK